MDLIKLDKINTLISTTSGFDSVVRVVVFTSLLLSTTIDENNDKELKKFLSDINSKASLTRLILHLSLPSNIYSTVNKNIKNNMSMNKNASPFVEIISIVKSGETKHKIIEDIIPQLQIISRTALMVRYLCESFLCLSRIEPKSYLGLNGPELGRRTATFGTVYNFIECIINSLRIIEYFGKSEIEKAKLSVLSKLHNLIISLIISALDLLSAFSSARNISLLNDFQSGLVGSIAAILNLYLRLTGIN